MLIPEAVVLMTKYPLEGRVKTRLTPPLSAREAAEVHRSMLVATFRTLSRLEARVLVAGDCDVEPDKYLSLLHLDRDRFIVQRPGNLGHRLAGAIDDARKISKNVLVVGSDSPQITSSGYLEALRSIGTQRMSIGPAEDGGFWCIGVDPSVPADRLFRGIEWSSGKEYGQVVRNARELGIWPCTLGLNYDVDRLEDLRRLIADLSLEACESTLLAELLQVTSVSENGTT